jgi:nucleoid-associated protein YgaU
MLAKLVVLTVSFLFIFSCSSLGSRSSYRRMESIRKSAQDFKTDEQNLANEVALFRKKYGNLNEKEQSFIKTLSKEELKDYIRLIDVVKTNDQAKITLTARQFLSELDKGNPARKRQFCDFMQYYQQYSLEYNTLYRKLTDLEKRREALIEALIQTEPSPQAAQAPPEPTGTGPSTTTPPPTAAVPAAPQAGEPPAEPVSGQTITYKVAPQDRLLKIVSTYYPDNKNIGYDAVILANPHITNEDFIYPGQTLTLPKVNNTNNIITIDGNEYFKMYGVYYSSSEVARATAELKELQLHFVVRETEIPGKGKIYRFFLGSYGSLGELKKAMTELGNR